MTACCKRRRSSALNLNTGSMHQHCFDFFTLYVSELAALPAFELNHCSILVL